MNPDNATQSSAPEFQRWNPEDSRPTFRFDDCMLSRQRMLNRFMARDSAYDGRFLTGVVTTGIYCLPSCPARKPKAENVRFVRTEAEARALGLRPCRRCCPDAFYEQRDPELELVQRLAEAVRVRPGDFASLAVLARWAGIGVTRLNDLCRRHFHDSAAGFLLRQRVAYAAAELLEGDHRVLDVALNAGFESSSTFHDNFKKLTGMAPRAYRGLGQGDGFALGLPPDFRREDTLAALGRDPESPAERRSGRDFAWALELSGRPVVLAVELGKSVARCRVALRGCPGAAVMAEAHQAALRLLGLQVDPGPFERRTRRMADGGRALIRGRAGLRVPQTASVFAGLLWAVIGQQINLPLAYRCRRALIERCGRRVGDGLVAPPAAEVVAALDHDDLTRLQFSRRKAEYVIDASRAIAAGALDLDGLREVSAVTVQRTLSGIRGFGPWSTNYVMMRSLGLQDCVPIGDAGLTRALQEFFGLEERPDAERTRQLMAPWAPYRSLATNHLWQSLVAMGGEE